MIPTTCGNCYQIDYIAWNGDSSFRLVDLVMWSEGNVCNSGSNIKSWKSYHQIIEITVEGLWKLLKAFGKLGSGSLHKHPE